MKKRSEIEEKYKWDLSKFCKNDQEFKTRLDALEKQIPNLASFKGKLSNEEILFDFLEKDNAFSVEFALVGCYAELNSAVDVADAKFNEMCEMVSKVSTKASVELSFAEVEISAFSNEKLEKLIKNEKFKNYKRFFEGILREKKHILSEKEEKLISQMGDFLSGFDSNFEKFMYCDFKCQDALDSKGKSHEVTNSTYHHLMEDGDRTLRKNAYLSYNKALKSYMNLLSNNYINAVKQDCTFAKIRSYKSALDASIYNEEASAEVYDFLIKKVRENVNIIKRYMALKKKFLNLDDFAAYDASVPMVKVKKTYTFEEAFDIVKKATACMGKEYTKLLDRAQKERWVDVYPTENKTTGGFCADTYGASPVILMNFNNDLEGVFTLAHELGHAMHSHYSNETQPSQTAHYTLFVAEVASTTNEILLVKYLLENAKDKDERIWIYDKFLSELRGAVFTQAMYAEFEEEVHALYENGGCLTNESVGAIAEKLSDFYNAGAYPKTEYGKNFWARVPHFYTSFYVYKYATAFMCACNVANHLKTDKDFLKKYKTFLSSGSIADPITLLKRTDCDLTKSEIYDEVFDFANQILTDWENA